MPIRPLFFHLGKELGRELEEELGRGLEQQLGQRLGGGS